MPPNKFSGSSLLETVHTSFAGALTPDKFGEVAKTGVLPEDFALGQIVWSKGLGRPDALRLSDGFAISAFQMKFADTDAEHRKDLYLPRWFIPSLWDGAAQDDQW